jgi:aryl-alcohol dehydrogenase-like predicted oxidoreductase
MKNKLYRQLGQSELYVSPIGLGCWQFSKQKSLVGKFWPAVSDEETREIIRVSVSNSINWFDTAEAYGWGVSEKSVSQALKALKFKSDDLLVATKWWPLLRTAGSIRRTIGKRIRALDGLSIDLYQIHQPFSLSSIAAQMQALADLITARKIRYAGVSNFSARQMKTAYDALQKFDIPLVSNQVSYSLLDRRIETNGVLDTARDLGISIIAYSPLAQGLLTGKFHKDPQLLDHIGGMRRWMPAFKAKGITKSQNLIDALQQVADKYEKTIAQIVLNWTIHFNGDVIVAIPGATSAQQAQENALAQQFLLDKQDLDLIDAAARRSN